MLQAKKETPLLSRILLNAILPRLSMRGARPPQGGEGHHAPSGQLSCLHHPPVERLWQSQQARSAFSGRAHTCTCTMHMQHRFQAKRSPASVVAHLALQLASGQDSVGVFFTQAMSSTSSCNDGLIGVLPGATRELSAHVHSSTIWPTCNSTLQCAPTQQHACAAMEITVFLVLSAA